MIAKQQYIAYMQRGQDKQQSKQPCTMEQSNDSAMSTHQDLHPQLPLESGEWKQQWKQKRVHVCTQGVTASWISTKAEARWLAVCD